jgi:hypothetical protein
MALVKQFGLRWPRNQENLDELEDLAGHKSGIYVLYHGAMPCMSVAERLARGCALMARKGRKGISSGIASRGS